MTNPIAPPTSTAAEFSPKEPFVGLYTMLYKPPSIGNHLIAKNFRFNGPLHEARKRALKYCEIMGAKLNWVEPLISDLTKEEKDHLGVTFQSNAGARTAELGK